VIRGQVKMSATLRSEGIDLSCSPAAMLGSVAQYRDPLFLDSSGLSGEFGRFSVLACQPVEVLTLRDGVLTDSQGRLLAGNDADVWSVLSRAFKCVEIDQIEGRPAGYAPGWYGYLGYELGRHTERLPGKAVRDTSFPDLRLGFYDSVLVFDALEKSWSLVWLDWSGHPMHGGGDAHGLLSETAHAARDSLDGFPCPVEQASGHTLPIAEYCPNFSPEQYKKTVARCVEYIAEGDIFQVNLSQRLAVKEAPDPLDIYRVLRIRNPSWYAAYLGFDCDSQPCAIASCSPELFLRVQGDHVLTRPVKGTMPRVGDATRDRASAKELVSSIKDNAELAMIIDLLRNDLGRVCSFRSIRVSEPRRLEIHPTVFHLVGSIQGRLRSQMGLADLIRATFPGGSITGAPKIRAMEIIDELEPVARGVYTGSIGHAGVDGHAEWSIAIRTIVCQSNTAYVQAGGGIVADSTPEGEYAETLDKARGMLEALAEARVSAST